MAKSLTFPAFRKNVLLSIFFPQTLCVVVSISPNPTVSPLGIGPFPPFHPCCRVSALALPLLQNACKRALNPLRRYKDNFTNKPVYGSSPVSNSMVFCCNRNAFPTTPPPHIVVVLVSPPPPQTPFADASFLSVHPLLEVV